MLYTARAPRPTAELDFGLLWLAIGLMAIGLVMVYSASIAIAEAARYTGSNGEYYLLRQGIFIALGIGAGVAAFQVPMRVWQQAAPYLFLAGLLLLVVVLIPGIGREVNGSRRWIPLGFANLQPSELMKLLAVLYAADYTARKAALMDDFKRGFLPMAAVMMLVGSLLLVEPDFGAFVVIVSIAMGILFLGGLNGRLFVAITVLLVAGLAAIVWLFPYRRERIFAYLDPWAAEHVLKKGYQLTHSLIAFGRGEWFGVGLGGSVEKLHYLTEAHTDFIVAVIAEELGLVAVLALVLAFYWLTKRAFEIGRQAVALERTFAGLVAQGIGIWFGVQSFINIGVASGLLPTKGLTLPLVSYGGSAMLANIVAIGLLVRVDFESRTLMRGGRA
jgi:cell division protein FtsW